MRLLSIKGYLCFYISICLSCLSDIFTSILIKDIDNYQILFSRFCVGAIVSFLYLKFKSQKLPFSNIKFNNNLKLHALRALVLLCAFIFWNKGLENNNVSTAALFNYFIPTITLILGRIILKEQFQKVDWIYNFTLILCISILIDNDISKQAQIVHLLFSVILFSSSDIINKKIVNKTNIIDIAIYTFYLLTVLTFPLAAFNWSNITAGNFYIILLLGLSTFFTLIFLLLALEMCKVSSLALHRYIELPISIILGTIFLNQTPDAKVIISAAIILFILIIKLIYDTKWLSV